MKIKNKGIYIKRWFICSLFALISLYLFSVLLNQSINSPFGTDPTADLINPNIVTTSQHPETIVAPEPTPKPELPPELFLVNKDNPVPASYLPDGLINVYEKYKTKDVSLRDVNVLMNEEAFLACREMFIAAKADGLKGMYILSGFRDYNAQAKLYDEYVTLGGLSDEYPQVAQPGESEHHTGYAIDIAILSEYTQATNLFEQTVQGKWFMENCWDYGFIMRYPTNKKHITGITYESWHYRYVGKQHSLNIKNSGLCLEEYLETLYN